MFKFEYCPLCQATLNLQANKDDGYIHCTSNSCDFILYENPTPVVAAVVEYGENQVVLGHNEKWPWKFYGLITGFLEKHEHPDECIIREIKEEIGLDGKIESFIGHYTFKKMNQVIIAYHVKATGEIILEDEIDDVRVIPFDKVKTWPGGTGWALRDLLKSKGYDPEELQFPKQK